MNSVRIIFINASNFLLVNKTITQIASKIAVMTTFIS